MLPLNMRRIAGGGGGGRNWRGKACIVVDYFLCDELSLGNVLDPNPTTMYVVL